ncbi:MAG: hypothetical protein KTR25_17835 [Myxococcales bacterium]|nr:hypothetical protein [Myxococcales bacterium]
MQDPQHTNKPLQIDWITKAGWEGHSRAGMESARCYGGSTCIARPQRDVKLSNKTSFEAALVKAEATIALYLNTNDAHPK